jgi:hypothetical protein
MPRPAIPENFRPVGKTEAEQFPDLPIFVGLEIVFFDDFHRRRNRRIGFGHSFAKGTVKRTPVDSTGHYELVNAQGVHQKIGDEEQ